MAKRDRKALMARNTIIGVGAVIAIGIIAYGTLYSTGVTDGGDIVEGEHYRALADVRALRPGDNIEVREYFSYGCIHCKNFDPLIEGWASSKADDVEFVRQPVSFSNTPIWVLLARTALTLQALDALDENHERLFIAIHESRKQFLTPEMVADFVDGNGTTTNEFLRTFNSPGVRARLRELEQDQRDVGITGVPSLLVAGRYVVNMDVGRKRALEVVDYLIDLSRKERTGAATTDG